MPRHDQPRREYLYGLNPVTEALGGRRRLLRLWTRDTGRDAGRPGTILSLARQRGVEVHQADGRRLNELTDGGNHQGVVLEAGPYPYVGFDDLIRQANSRTVLVLDRVQDPQNLATLIRTAVAVDAAGIVIQTDRSASITPAVVRSSAGLVEHAMIARVNNTRGALDLLKEAGYWAVGLEAGEGSIDIYHADVPEPTALVVGSEATGISRAVLRACDLIVSLPMPGRAESLNAAVAGSVAVFELLRRRDQSTA